MRLRRERPRPGSWTLKVALPLLPPLPFSGGSGRTPDLRDPADCYEQRDDDVRSADYNPQAIGPCFKIG
jgi:hypothetical protein